MKLSPKLGTMVAVAGALAVAVPAAAHPTSSDHPGGNQPAQSHKCKPHNVGYVESGVVDSATASTLTQNSDGTWSGTLVVDVTRTNHAAKADKGQTVSYSFDSATLRVRFDDGTTGFTAGERVHLIGKLATVAKKCAALSPAATPVFRTVVVHPAATSSGS